MSDASGNRAIDFAVTRALESAGANYDQPTTIDEVKASQRPWPGSEVIHLMTCAAAMGWSAAVHAAFPRDPVVAALLNAPIVGDGAPKSRDPLGWRSMPSVDEVNAHAKRHAWITVHGITLSIWQARGRADVPGNPCFGSVVVVGVLDGVVHGALNNGDPVPLEEVFNGEAEWRPMTARHEPAGWPDE